MATQNKANNKEDVVKLEKLFIGLGVKNLSQNDLQKIAKFLDDRITHILKNSIANTMENDQSNTPRLRK